MSEEVYAAIAHATSGFVEAPAGCGKTEAIVRTVADHCVGTQLVLTHTYAGVDALRRRFRLYGVLPRKYHVDTIAGWAWGWVRRYPVNAAYTGSTDIAVWADVYAAMTTLLQKEFVRQGVFNSYAGIIVDEYQDCTVAMHRLIVALKALLPCRVLGDDLQGIFGFRDEPLIGWGAVKTEFENDLGVLDTPHRWMKAQSDDLGFWLLDARPAFRAETEPDYTRSPIDRRSWRAGDVSRELIRLTGGKDGRICIIGPKTRRLSAGLETALVNRGYNVLEANDLSELRMLVEALADGTAPEKANAASRFLSNAFGGIGDEQNFMDRILRGENQAPRRANRGALCRKHRSGTTLPLLSDLLSHIEMLDESSRKLRESVSALKCILDKDPKDADEIKALYASEVARRKHISRGGIPLSIGSTLLVKGLEFEHAVVLRSDRWQQSWGSYKDLYVALTRGARTATLVDVTR